MDLQSKEICVIRNNKEIIIPLSEVLIKDVVYIKPGEKIPVDGLVSDGETYIDESLLTGEPIPVAKTKNSKVYAGTVNTNGFLKIIAEKIGKETFLSQIIKVVQQAQNSKPPIQRLVDKISEVFVPLIILISSFTFIIWYFIAGYGFVFSLTASISVLIIACPCALGLATPTAIIAGIGKAAENGIIVKDINQLEMLHKVNAFVFDKTGTITEGKPFVEKIYWQVTNQNDYYISVLFALEKRSTHPIASSIINYYKDYRIPYTLITDFKEVTGKGLQGKTDNNYFFVGNSKFITENNIDINNEQSEIIQTAINKGNSIILFANSSKIIAIITISDKLKEFSYETIKQIKESGIKTFLMTGDNKRTSEMVAHTAAIETVYSEITPIEKGKLIGDMQKNKYIVAMFGDGINDSVALTQADVGISMSHGSDIAIESAGIIVTNRDIRTLSKVIKISGKTIKTIKQNLFWAFFYNILSIPIAAGLIYPLTGFLLNPMLAAMAMSLSSITVVTNSLRLKK